MHDAEIYMHVRERCRKLIQLLYCLIYPSAISWKMTSLHILKKMRVSDADDGVDLMIFTGF